MCDVLCETSFSAKASLKNYISAVNEGKKPFECNFCSASCALNTILNIKIKANLGNHVKGVHEKIKPFKCDICGTEC